MKPYIARLRRGETMHENFDVRSLFQISPQCFLCLWCCQVCILTCHHYIHTLNPNPTVIATVCAQLPLKHSLSLHLYYEYTYSRDSRVLFIHRACARCSTPSSPMALWRRLQKTQQWKWSQANVTHWLPGGDTYLRDLRDVLVRNPSAMAFAPCDVALQPQRLLWRESLSVRHHKWIRYYSLKDVQ